MAEDRNVILPVWHGVTHAEVAAASPPLADLLAVNTNNGMPAVADSVARALRRNRIADLVECYLDAVAADRDRVGAGDLLTVGCRVVNPGNRPAKLELGASLVGREGPTYVDPAADTAIEVEPQSVSVHERRFRVPANAERGSYDLVLALWVGPPGRDGLRVHARSAEHGIDVL